MNYNLPTIQEKKYQNPVQYNDQKKYTNPDPYVIRFAGKYYCYASDEFGVNVSVSEDLVNWEYKGYALEESQYHNYWAPSVIYYNGLFYMYYSSTDVKEEDCHQEFLKLAIAENPIGPFIYKKTFFDKFSIDAHVVQVEGEFYIFYSTNDIVGTDDNKAGTCILVDRLIDMERLEGNPHPVILPTIEEEMFQKNRFGDGRDWYTIEGAFYLHKRNKSYLMYSANAYVNTNYYIGYATSDYQKDLKNMMWKKYPDNYTFQPLVKKNEQVEGTGHNSIIKAPNLVDDWIIYHGREGKEDILEGVEQRVMRIDPLFYNGEQLFTNAPSSQFQDAPAMPDVKVGNFKVDRSWISPKEFPVYIAEVSLITKKLHTGERYGLYLNYCNEQNYIEVEIHSGNNEVVIYVVDRGIKTAILKQKLTNGYNHQVIHTINTQKRINSYTLQIDDGTIVDFTYHMEHGRFGISAYYTAVHILNITLTEHLELWGKELSELSYLFHINEVIESDINGLISNKKKPWYIERPEFICDGYTEEFTFEFMGNNGEIDYSMLTEEKKKELQAIITKDKCSIQKSGEEHELSGVQSLFSLRIMVNKENIWLMINGGNSEKIRLDYPIKHVVLKLKNVKIKGYQKTIIQTKK